MTKDVPLRVLTFNTHVGRALASTIISWVFRRWPLTDIYLIQEASRPQARKRLRKSFPVKKWIVLGPDRDDKLVGTYVVARRKRFHLIRKVNDKISNGLGPDMYGRVAFPQRNLTGAVLFDRRTGRYVYVTSVHTWHIVGRTIGGNSNVVLEHTKQTRMTAQWHKETGNQESVHLSGGDWNEKLSDQAQQDLPASTTTHMGRIANMVPTSKRAASRTGSPHLDEVFYRPRPYLRVATWTKVTLPFRAADHPVVRVTLMVTPTRRD